MKQIVALWLGTAISLLATVPALAVTHEIDSVSLTPSAIATNAPTTITVTAQISDPAVIPSSVNLLAYDSSGNATILGSLANVSDSTYVASVSASPAAGTQFAVSAAFKGALRRTISPRISVATVSVPDSFVPNSALLAAGGALSLDNFSGDYLHGGIIPAGGGVIDITSVPLPPPPLSDFITRELEGTSIASTTSVTVSGITCTNVVYTDTTSVDADSPQANVAIYCPTSNALFEFYLTYNVGDPNESQFLTSLQGVLSSAQLNP